MASFIQVDELTKSFGDLLLFSSISFTINEKQQIGIIAKNGAGKTTLLNILAKKDSFDSGVVAYHKDIKIGYLNQDPHYPGHLSVLEACFQSDNEIVKLIADYEQAVASGNHQALETLLVRMDHLKAWNYEQQVKQILSRLKITCFDQKINTLSGGQLKRVALANVLITGADLLMLDEPTNHLDLEMTEWLEDYLKRSEMTLLMVTHDRYFLDRVCSEIYEIDNRKLYTYKGNYSYYVEKKQERLDAQQAERERDKNIFRKELEWMRRQPQARATKAKARIDSFHELETKLQQERASGNINLNIKAAYIGNKIFEAKHVSKNFDFVKIVEDFNYTFARYEKLGIAGNNGTGKTTFIKMLVGEVEPDKGEFEIGETVQFGYYSQDGLSFNENMKVIDVVQEIAEVIDVGGTRLTASQFLQHFLFPPEQQHSFVHKLSGGEKRRLYLCTVLIKNPNFLVLDEPTNDLDIITLNILEEYITAFKGCVIVVSHDRYFMDKVVNHLFVFEGNAVVRDFPGNYTQYRDWKNAIIQETKEKERKKERQPSSQTAPVDSSPPENKKLSFKEKRELETLESDIQELETEQKELEEELSSGALMPDALLKKSERIGEVLALIDTKTMRWLELADLIRRPGI